MAKFVVPAVAGAVALSAVGGGLWATYAFSTTPVTLSVDGVSAEKSVRASTVGEVLNEEGITLSEHDVVQPAADTKISDGLAISVLFARPLEVTLDGVKKTYWTTATNVADALAQLKLSTSEADKISASRSASIGREGLAFSILTAKNVTVTAAGTPTQLTIAGTVGDALTQAGITPDADDQVTPAVDTELTEGAEIVFKSVEVKTVSKNVEVPFEKKKVESGDLYVGETKVTTKGVVGAATQEVKETYVDGELASSDVVSTKTTKEPVTQVTTVGTKARPAKAASSGSSGGSNNLTPAQGASCKASYYWQGQRTANGEWFNTNDLTAAHKSLPFNSRVKVTNPANGKSVIVRINDRGPYIAGRCLDLSRAAMSTIGGTSAGVITVNYEVL
ncbi:MAG: septal ring lytic transglycosylase RlpA family protein [Propionibacteriaceae bacterium]|nr:septal ring lytic transglycosylase RlpA family protein [Propionibacteriaceae bacterium]